MSIYSQVPNEIALYKVWLADDDVIYVCEEHKNYLENNDKEGGSS